MTDAQAEPFGADQLAHILRCTSYAPSPRGMRPWRLRAGADRIDVYSRPTASLAESDPDGRQQTLACGSVVHYLRMSMSCIGFDSETVWLPDPQAPEHLATIRRGRPRQPTAAQLRLHQQVARRPSNRYGYRYARVDHRLESKLDRAGWIEGAWVHVVGDWQRAQLVELHMRAAAQLVADAAYRSELVEWMRRTPSPPGHLGGSRFLADSIPPRPYLLPAPVSPEDMVDQQEVLSAVVVGHHGDEPEHWLRTGAALAGLGLAAAGEGLAVSFFSQVVEVPELRARMTEAFSLPGPPHGVVRLGYPAEPTPGAPSTGVYSDRFSSLVAASGATHRRRQ